MSKGGGGGPDLSGLQDATKEAAALQKEVYGDIRGMAQPYQDLGAGAVGRLSDLLGVSGGSIQSRDQIYNDLAPQYTTMQGGGTNSGLIAGAGGTYGLDQLLGMDLSTNNPDYYNLRELQARLGAGQDITQSFDEQGSFGDLSLVGYQPQSESIDYEALNAAVEDRLSGQETPSDYGTLLDRFDMTKFEEDPGYQFRKDQSQQALERSMAAQGVTLGGGGFGSINPQVAQALMDQSQGLASQEYGNAYNRYVNDQLNTFNMLTGASGIGQGTLGTVAGAGQNMATNVGQLQTGLASAQMNAQMAQQSQPSMFGTILGGAAGAFLGNPSLGAAAGNAIFSGGA